MAHTQSLHTQLLPPSPEPPLSSRTTRSLTSSSSRATLKCRNLQPDVMLYSRPLHWCADTDASTPLVHRRLHWHAKDCGLAFSKTPRTPAEDASGCPRIDMTFEEYQEREQRRPAKPLRSHERQTIHSKYLESAVPRNNSPLPAYQRPTAYARRGKKVSDADGSSGGGSNRSSAVTASTSTVNLLVRMKPPRNVHWEENLNKS